MRTSLGVLASAVVAAALAGCSGQPCEDLPGLRAERDAARAAYLELAGSGSASTDETEEADAELHAIERRVFDIEQECEAR